MNLNILNTVDFNDPLTIAIICGAALCVVALGFTIAYFSLRKRYRRVKGSATKAERVKIKDGVRYSVNEHTLKSSGEVKAGLIEKDKLLTRGKEYVVGKNEYLLPGKYTVLSSDESVEGMNVRIAGFVRQVKHMDSIVLTEGDKICAVSHALVLR